jgi:hypothetical protein
LLYTSPALKTHRAKIGTGQFVGLCATPGNMRQQSLRSVFAGA